jgi:fatty acid desaturase
MGIISVILGGATHAFAHTHRIHHRRCLAPDDLEGRAAAYGFWQALWRSPFYPLQLHAAALRQGDARLRSWIVGELLAVAAVQSAVWLLLDVPALQAASLTLLVANALVPMVGIWAVHRGCHGTPHVARTSRLPRLDRLVVHMFQHDEHHRFPQVPTRHLPELVRRLDAREAASPAPAVIELPIFFLNLKGTLPCSLPRSISPTS